MSILIVDDESNTREVLRGFLQSLGRKNILEASNGLEAIKIVEQEKTRIKVIVADWEMPQMDGLSLVKKIADYPELDHTPFLLITSDLPESTIKEFYKENPRLDGYLNKPFQKVALERAINEAYKKRCGSHHTILYINREEPPPALIAALQESMAHHWRQLVRTDSLEGLRKLVENNGRQLGAIFVDSATSKDFEGDWLGAFKKTLQGSKVVVCCLGDEASEALHLCTQCNFFFGPMASRKDWDQTLKTLSQRVIVSAEVENLLKEAKSLVHQQKVKEAQKIIKRLFFLDPDNTEILSFMGDLEDGKKAVALYEKALSLNPYLPHAHIKLLGLYKLPQERIAAADLASRLCPNSIDVLSVATEAYTECGKLDKASELAVHISKIMASQQKSSG